jgi:hypothetical protein
MFMLYVKRKTCLWKNPSSLKEAGRCRYYNMRGHSFGCHQFPLPAQVGVSYHVPRIPARPRAEGVSINTLVLALIAEGLGRHEGIAKGELEKKAA